MWPLATGPVRHPGGGQPSVGGPINVNSQVEGYQANMDPRGGVSVPRHSSKLTTGHRRQRAARKPTPSWRHCPPSSRSRAPMRVPEGQEG